MKSKFKMLAVLAAFAVTAPVLVACGDAKSNAPAGSTEPGQSTDAPSNVISGNGPVSSDNCADTFVKRLTVKAPTTVIEGESYNLDDYVTMVVEGCGHIEYEVVVETKGTARVVGHTLHVTGVGSVSLEIKADGKSAIFSSEAIAKLQYDYDQATKDVANNYVFYQLGIDNKTLEVEKEEWMLHNERYTFIDDYDISDGEYTPAAGAKLNGGGIMQLRNGDTYFYNLYNNADVALVEKSSADFNLYYVDMPLNLPYTAFTADYDYLTPEGTDVEQVLKATCTDGKYDFFDNGSVFNQNLISELRFKTGGDTYVPHTIFMYPWVDDQGQELWRMDVQLAKKTAKTIATNQWSYWAFDFDKDNAHVDALETYIDTAPLPDAIEFGEIGQSFDSLITAKNYTLQVDVTICKYGDKEHEITELDGTGLYLESTQTSTVKVDNGKYYNTYHNFTSGTVLEDGIFAAYEKDGKLMTFSKHGDAEATTPAQATGSNGNGLTSLWGETDLVPGDLASTSEVYGEGKFEALGRKENGSTLTITAVGDKIETFFRVFCVQDSIGQYICSWNDSVGEQNNVNCYGWYDFAFEITAGAGLHVEISRTYSELEDGTRTYAYIDYYYKNIGSTTIPELDAYLA